MQDNTNQQTSETPRGISNDQTATKVGRARARLRQILPAGATITAMQINRHGTTNGNSIFEYYMLAIDPQNGAIVLLNRELRAIGFGYNRMRGTIRTSDYLWQTIGLIGVRVLGDPKAYRVIQLEPTI
jgi:hypothetical protein